MRAFDLDQFCSNRIESARQPPLNATLSNVAPSHNGRCALSTLVFKDLNIERSRIPLIPAGGVNSHKKVRTLLELGASAVQIGTPFAVTEEGDAHEHFKQVLVHAKPEDIVTFMSVAGLPARAVLTPRLKNYLRREKALQCHAKADPRRCVPGFECLTVCGLRDGIAGIGQFCIDTRLAFALKGDVKKGLFFRGSESLPFGNAIRPVAELLDYFLTGKMPNLSPAIIVNRTVSADLAGRTA